MGCPEPENRLCVPSGCSPTGAGTGQGVGEAQSTAITQALVLTPRPWAPGASKGDDTPKEPSQFHGRTGTASVPMPGAPGSGGPGASTGVTPWGQPPGPGCWWQRKPEP